MPYLKYGHIQNMPYFKYGHIIIPRIKAISNMGVAEIWHIFYMEVFWRTILWNRQVWKCHKYGLLSTLNWVFFHIWTVLRAPYRQLCKWQSCVKVERFALRLISVSIKQHRVSMIFIMPVWHLNINKFVSKFLTVH